MSSVALKNLPLFGRYYSLQVKFPPNDNGEQTVLTLTDSSFEPEALRITFDVYTPAWEAWWHADISIYNVDQVTATQIIGGGGSATTPSGIKQGMEVILSAGYLNGNQGVIFDGFVFQPLWDRENVTDFKITLRCVVGLTADLYNSINQNYAAGLTQNQLVQKMASDCYRPIAISGDQITSLPDRPLKRGITVVGNPRKHLSFIAQDNNAQTWISASGLTMANINSDLASTADAIVYTPETGIVGTPQQTQYGVNLRLLLDPRVKAQKPFMLVAIDNTVIQQQKKQLGVLPGLLDQNGQYAVLGVRHIGDTRGNEWYTEVQGVTTVNGKLAGFVAVGAAAIPSYQQGGRTGG